MKTIAIMVALTATAAFSQVLRKPAAREHVKIINGVPVKFTSRLATVVELNFTMNNGHQPGKQIISAALSRIATNYGGITVNKFTTSADGSVKGVVPAFTINDLTAGEVIVANNISYFGDAAVGAAKQTAIQSAIEVGGRGYLGFHGSGDNEATGWPWFTNTLHPMNYKGHGNRSQAPIYKHLATAKHLILDSIMMTGTSKAIVPNELDESGNEILSPDSVPMRRMKNEWYRFARDISRDAAYKDKVTILLKYDARALGSSDLEAQYKRKGGNMYTYLYKVGNGMTSYIPAGHENDELLAPTTGFDGGAGDFDRYVAQVLFFLAGYNETNCDASCEGLPIADTANILTGDKYVGTGTAVWRAVAIRPEFNFNPLTMGFSTSFEKKSYEARLTDVHGRLIALKSGKGRITYKFDRSRLPQGVYYLRIQIGSSAPQSKRYILIGSR